MRINFSMIAAKLRGRATFKPAPGVRITATARIINMSGDSERISVGRNSIVQGELLLFRHGGTIKMGEWCFLGPNSRIWSGASISIGNHVLIAHNVSVMDNLTHPLDAAERRRHFQEIYLRGHPKDIDLEDRPIVVEDDVWIGAGATVLRGVRIGARAIVAAGAVVTSDVAEDTVVAGNPARLVRDNRAVGESA